MTVVVKNVTDTKGGTGGVLSDDFKDILNTITYGGAANIQSINVKAVTDVRAVDFVECIRFVYSVVTKSGVTYEHQGNKRGGDGNGVSNQPPFDFVANGNLTQINGRIGLDPGGATVVKYVAFQTPKQTTAYGKVIATEKEFTLPPGVMFGNSKVFIDSLGVYEITEGEQPAMSATSTVTETKTVSSVTVTAEAVAQTIYVDNPRTIIGLGVPLAALCILLLGGLYYKYHQKRKNSILRIAGGV